MHSCRHREVNIDDADSDVLAPPPYSLKGDEPKLSLDEAPKTGKLENTKFPGPAKPKPTPVLSPIPERYAQLELNTDRSTKAEEPNAKPEAGPWPLPQTTDCQPWQKLSPQDPSLRPRPELIKPPGISDGGKYKPREESKQVRYDGTLYLWHVEPFPLAPPQPLPRVTKIPQIGGLTSKNCLQLIYDEECQSKPGNGLFNPLLRHGLYQAKTRHEECIPSYDHKLNHGHYMSRIGKELVPVDGDPFYPGPPRPPPAPRPKPRPPTRPRPSGPTPVRRTKLTF